MGEIDPRLLKTVLQTARDVQWAFFSSSIITDDLKQVVWILMHCLLYFLNSDKGVHSASPLQKEHFEREYMGCQARGMLLSHR